MNKYSKIAAGLYLLFLSGCAVEQVPVTDPVTWYAANNTGSSMTIILYDKICNRRFGNVQIRAKSETVITTCGDGNGRSEFRYRMDGYASRSPGWTHSEISGSNQRLYLN